MQTRIFTYDSCLPDSETAIAPLSKSRGAGDWCDSLPAGKRVSINDGAQSVEPETRTLDDDCIPKTELESRRTKIALTTLAFSVGLKAKPLRTWHHAGIRKESWRINQNYAQNQSRKATDCTLVMSKRFRQRMFLHI